MLLWLNTNFVTVVGGEKVSDIIKQMDQGIEKIISQQTIDVKKTKDGEFSKNNMDGLIIHLLYENMRLNLKTAKANYSIGNQTDKITKRAYLVAWISLIASGVSVGFSILNNVLS